MFELVADRLFRFFFIYHWHVVSFVFVVVDVITLIIFDVECIAYTQPLSWIIGWVSIGYDCAVHELNQHTKPTKPIYWTQLFDTLLVCFHIFLSLSLTLILALCMRLLSMSLFIQLHARFLALVFVSFICTHTHTMLLFSSWCRSLYNTSTSNPITCYLSFRLQNLFCRFIAPCIDYIFNGLNNTRKQMPLNSAIHQTKLNMITQFCFVYDAMFSATTSMETTFPSTGAAIVSAAITKSTPMDDTIIECGFIDVKIRNWFVNFFFGIPGKSGREVRRMVLREGKAEERERESSLFCMCMVAAV